VAQQCTRPRLTSRLAVLALVVALPAAGVLHHQCDDGESEDAYHGHTVLADTAQRGGLDTQHGPDESESRCAGTSCTSVPVPSLRQTPCPDVPQQQAAVATDRLLSTLETPEPPVPRRLLRA
jgi:hypothetical protein